MFLLRHRDEFASNAANKVASAGGGRFQNSAFANTVLAPVIANRFPYIITPYLGLRARLSQIWINRWTILLLLVLVRTLIAIASLHDNINSARKEALSACTGIEGVGSAMASMPHYLSQGVNALTADGIDRAVNGLMSMLLMTVTGVEEIVLFVINMLTSTYLCLITLVVRGALHAAIALIEEVSDFLNTTIGAIGHDLHSTVDTFQDTYDKFRNELKNSGALQDVENTLGSIFGDDANISLPKLDVSSDLDKLDNLQLPSGLDADLENLSKKIPNFEEVQNFTNSVISWPFEEIKKLINESLPKYKFDRSLFPVPAKEQLTFCSDNNGINEFFDDLLDLNSTARKVAIAVLLVLAVLICGPMAWSEVRSYRKMQKRAEALRSGSKAPMDSVYIVSRPNTADAGLKAAKAFKANRRQALVRWAIAYATTVPALFVLSLGLAGLFSCLCRYCLLRAVQHEVPSLVNEVSDFAGKVVNSLDNASTSWANGTNDVILQMNNKINEDVFGWVNTSTHAVNHTLNVFVDESIHVIKEAFGGTVLYGPVKELFNCLVGLKVTSIEKGLTWVHEHAHIEFPLLPSDTFSLGAAASIAGDSGTSSFLANPTSGTTDEITSIVNSLADKIERSIRNEAIISACVVGVWVVVALMGICRALWLFWGTGHMPEDYGMDGNDEPIWEEKSPSFVGTGEYFGSPGPNQTNPFEKRSPPDVQLHPATPRNGTSEDSTLPDYSVAVGQGNSGNQYKGQSYTITPRPFPKFSGYPHETSTTANKTMNQQEVQRSGSLPQSSCYPEKSHMQNSARGVPQRNENAAFGGTVGGNSRAKNPGVTFVSMGH